MAEIQIDVARKVAQHAATTCNRGYCHRSHQSMPVSNCTSNGHHLDHIESRGLRNNKGGSETRGVVAKYGDHHLRGERCYCFCSNMVDDISQLVVVYLRSCRLGFPG